MIAYEPPSLYYRWEIHESIDGKFTKAARNA